MGPGDTEVPPPALPYETSISHRGLISQAGQDTPLPSCSAEDIFGGYRVSLTGTDIAYPCAGQLAGAPPPVAGTLGAFLTIEDSAAPAGAPQKIGDASGAFQVSGNYVAYYSAQTLLTGEVVVAERPGGKVLATIPTGSGQYPTIALQEDGTLVLLDAGSSSCTPSGGTPREAVPSSYPAEWFSPGSTVAHQLGCFYDGSLRPVGGQWVALSPGPGAQASLVLLTLASGASHTLAVFANAGVLEPGGAALIAGSDFDGHQLAFVQQTCAGHALELDSELATLSPGAPSSARCPAQLQVGGLLRPDRRGNVHVRVSCAQGCPFVEVAIAQPRALLHVGTYLTLAPSARPKTVSFHLSRRELAYARRHPRERITVTALSYGLGSAPGSKTAVRVRLAR
jgi:hypothetical protein